MRQWARFMTGTTVIEVNLVEQTPRSGILWSGSTTVRARPWQHHPSRAFLLISGSHGPDLRLPDSSVIEGWLQQLAGWGYRSVRTSALSPTVATVFAGLGFEPAQELSLMSAVVGSDNASFRHPTPAVRAVHRLPGRPYAAGITESLLRVDRAAFGDDWCMDADMFDESRTATRRSRLLVASDHDQPVGFVAVGASGSTGFLQRLAVEPGSRRRGIASQLVAAALRWTSRVGCSQSIVNTATTNAPALSLYRRFGFAALDHGLTVMERPIP